MFYGLRLILIIYEQRVLKTYFTLAIYVHYAQKNSGFIWFPCRLPRDKVWCAYDVTLCVLYNHHVCVIHIERNTDSHAEVHRFVLFYHVYSG